MPPAAAAISEHRQRRRRDPQETRWGPPAHRRAAAPGCDSVPRIGTVRVCGTAAGMAPRLIQPRHVRGAPAARPRHPPGRASGRRARRRSARAGRARRTGRGGGPAPARRGTRAGRPGSPASAGGSGSRTAGRRRRWRRSSPGPPAWRPRWWRPTRVHPAVHGGDDDGLVQGRQRTFEAIERHARRIRRPTRRPHPVAHQPGWCNLRPGSGPLSGTSVAGARRRRRRPEPGIHPPLRLARA